MKFKNKLIRIIQEIVLLFSRKKKNVVIVFVPGTEFFSGGVLFLFYLFKESVKILNPHDTACFVCSLPYDNNILYYKKSGRGIMIFNYFAVLRKYRNADKIMLQIGESFVWEINKLMQDKQHKAAGDFHINVLNLNMEFMPPPLEIDKLKPFCKTLTITAAHNKYTEKSFSRPYGTEFSHLCPWFVEGELIPLPFESKRNILLVSHDRHEKKEMILDKIKITFPEIEIVHMPKMRFEDYLEFQSKAKWTITFGEGVDGYLVHSTLTGGICFAVKNSTFFTEDFNTLPNIFETFDDLYENISSFITRYDNANDYSNLNIANCKVIRSHYSPELLNTQLKELYHVKHGFALKNDSNT